MDKIFDGKYKILKVIGKGGMGTVYLAESLSSGEHMAIKAVPKKNAEYFDLLAEPKILKRLNHPALPKIRDVVQDKEYLYIIENYIEGISLDQELIGHRGFDEITVVEWAKQLCDVLTYLHNQHPPIIYRDMKPSNIIVSADGTVSVIDFGIAREYKIGGDHNHMGTRGYAAPEQYSAAQTDPRTDIYALGATLYHMLTGKNPNEPPYEFFNLRKLKPSLSEGIEYIVNKCTRKDPNKRYFSAIELKDDLEHIYKLDHEYKKYEIKRKAKSAMKITLLTVFTAIFLSSFWVISVENSDKNSGLIEQAKYASKLYEFEGVDDSVDNSKDTYLKNAAKMIKDEKYDECLEYLSRTKKSIEEAEQNSEYLYLVGAAYFGKEDYSEAINYLEKAVDLKPDNELYIRDMAVCCAKNGDIARAEELLDGLMNINGTAASTYYIAGEIYYEDGQYSDAVDCYSLALADTTEYEQKKKIYLGLSEAYKKNNEYEKAAECFNELLKMGYDKEYIYLNMAVIYQQTGNFDKAVEILDKMKKKYPENYRCYLMYAYVYMGGEEVKPENERDYSLVIENYNKAVSYAPEGEKTSDVVPIYDDLKLKGLIK